MLTRTTRWSRVIIVMSFSYQASNVRTSILIMLRQSGHVQRISSPTFSRIPPLYSVRLEARDLHLQLSVVYSADLRAKC